MKRLLFLVLAAFLLSPAVLLAHGSGSEHIQQFDSNITIGRDSVATIAETIVYDFGILDRHGIFRYVPTRTKAGDTGKFYFYDFKFVSAKVDGSAVPVDINRSGDFEVMRLGDPDKTISGVHTYDITYQLSPAVLRDDEGDFLNWNITGNQWEIPIEAASANISFPEGTGVKASRCYTGEVGSTDSDCAIKNRGPSLTVTTSNIDTGEGLTVNALLPANSFSAYLEPADPPLAEWLPLIGIVLAVLAVIFGLVVRLFSWLRHKWQLRQQLVIAQYEAPDNLSPAEIGLLNDQRSNMTEITATFIDLAVRGYLKIEQTQAKGLFKKAKYTFHLLKPKDTKLRKFEQDLLGMLFSGSSTTTKLEDIKATQASTTISSIHRHLKSQMKEKGYYAKPAKASAVRKVVRKLIILIVLFIIGINIYSAIVTAQPGLSIASTVAIIIGSLIGWQLAKRTELTPAGYSQWAKVEGLELFLTVTEKERLKFHDAPAKNPKLFNKLLPYAIALGVEKQWAKQFEGMDISKDTGWYSGTHAYTPFILASSLGSDFSPVVSSNFTPTQSSSSGGFSSGGFSGGGGGGGGGGSW